MLFQSFYTIGSKVVPSVPSPKEKSLIENLRRLLVCVWLSEASSLALLLLLYRVEAESDVRDFVSHLGFSVLLAAAIFLACMMLLTRRYYSAVTKEGGNPFGSILRWNVAPLVLMITIAEAGLRVFSTELLGGTLLADQPLGPRHLQAMTFFQRPPEILSYDPLLGWSVKPNLSSIDGLYFTGERGMRVSNSAIPMSARPQLCRIALVGDSHTFGEQLKFEETWGYLLKDYLPQRCEILNFGVSGYSVGQMYLRYMRDVSPSHPDMVIFALSSGTAARTMGVYGLNMWSDDLPWAQPRFEFIDHELVPINLPLPTLETIAEARAMSDLPYIDYDWFFVPGEWEFARWRYMYTSYLFRLYVTNFPPYRHQRAGNSREAINHELLRTFVRRTKEDGATPVLLYLPDHDEYKTGRHQENSSTSILRTSGIKYVDLRPCLDEIAESDRFIPNGDHYSLKGSIAIAHCIAQRLPPFKQTPPRLNRRANDTTASK